MTELLTPQEAANELRVTRRSVYEWLRTGRLEGARAGKGWRISREAVNRFLAERKQTERVAGWPCPTCEGELAAARLCQHFEDGEQYEVWLRCADDESHLFIHRVTEAQFARARAGDFGWLRGK